MQSPTGAQPSHPPSGPTRYPSSGLQHAPQIYRAPSGHAAPPTTAQPAPAQTGRIGGDSSNLATSMMKILRPGRAGLESTPGAVKIGRANDNDIVIPEVLASRHHATLIPTPAGTEIHDNRSINGTFVNGVRVDSAVLRDGDVVTIGNIDLVFHGGTLAPPRSDRGRDPHRRLDVRGVTWTIENNKTLLDNISLTALPGTLTAIIGPSGAGKSTFARLVAGYTHPTTGTVAFEGHNVHAEYASLRSRIGMVPQDDVVHGQLTVQQALMYAAELRLPPDTTKEDRAQVVARVLEELEMTQHLHTRVDKLSGGQRKRASVALELLTGPSLLILDEPTSGLDPALDRQVMTMLRQLADAGRVVLVVTHSLTYLDVCDQVLLLAPAGRRRSAGHRPDRPGHGHHQLGRHLQHRRGRPDGSRALPGPHRPEPPPPRRSSPPNSATRAHQSGPAVLHDRPPPDAVDRLRPRLLRIPGVAAVHHGFAVDVGARRRRLRHPQPDGRRPNEPGRSWCC
ncbi:ABC transporter family protein [Mycobacterium avium subsp. avium 2285 (R)]|nr:ABC transporter family protein [Mycobacterium avium subsp. avium 2285 (R)]